MIAMVYQKCQGFQSNCQGNILVDIRFYEELLLPLDSYLAQIEDILFVDSVGKDTIWTQDKELL
jgi:hypothetical protein